MQAKRLFFAATLILGSAGFAVAQTGSGTGGGTGGGTGTRSAPTTTTAPTTPTAPATTTRTGTNTTVQSGNTTTTAKKKSPCIAGQPGASGCAPGHTGNPPPG